MKKIFLLVALFVTICGLKVHAQSVYSMYSHGSGSGEMIDNLRNSTEADIWGIRFSSGSVSRGFVNNTGHWGLLKPGSYYISYPATFSNIINTVGNLTLGVEGWVCTEGLSVRTLDPSTTNTLDILTTGTKGTITSNGDSEGLHIRSAIGNKIYLYNKVYFDDQYWTSLGAGRNNDPTINNANDNKMMRLGSNGGIGFWGAVGVEANDTPQFYVSGTSLSANVPLSIQNANVKLFLGTAQDDKDGWIGTTTAQGLHLGANDKSVAYLGADDNMYVGLADDDVKLIRKELKDKYKLFVAKGTLSEDYAISPKSSWSDFVFSKNYVLPKISEVATFIQENNHLPDVPSAKQVAEEGYSQHDMNKVLLQKIEELTLYTIQQQKEIEALKTQLQDVKK